MTYRAGIIGTGGVAGMGLLGVHEEDIGKTKVEASHAGGYAATEGIELAAVADVDAEALSRFGDLWEVPPGRRYEDHDAMLRAEDLDVVSVCTPSYLHAEHVIDSAESAASPDASTRRRLTVRLESLPRLPSTISFHFESSYVIVFPDKYHGPIYK